MGPMHKGGVHAQKLPELGQIHSSRPLTSHLLLGDGRDFWDKSQHRSVGSLSLVPTTNTPQPHWKHRDHPLPMPLLSDSTPVPFCTCFPPPVPHNQRPRGSGATSDIAGDWDFPSTRSPGLFPHKGTITSGA